MTPPHQPNRRLRVLLAGVVSFAACKKTEDPDAEDAKTKAAAPKKEAAEQGAKADAPTSAEEPEAKAVAKAPEPDSAAGLEPCKTTAFTRLASLADVCKALGESSGEASSCVEDEIEAATKSGTAFTKLVLVCQEGETPTGECAFAAVTGKGVYAAQLGVGRSSMGTWTERKDVDGGRVLEASGLPGDVVQFEVDAVDEPRDPEHSMMADDEPVTAVSERAQWTCVAGDTPACWAWTVERHETEVKVREVEPVDPDDVPEPEVVRTERVDWKRTVTLDLSGPTARVEVADGAKAYVPDGPVHCRLDVAAKPAQPEVASPAKPFGPAQALATVLPDGAPYAKESTSLSEIGVEVDNGGVFKSSADEWVGAGWYENGDVGVLLHGEPADAGADHFLKKASTFARKGGTWSHVVTAGIYEDIETDYATAPVLIELGEHAGLLYHPAIQGCGAAPCRPKDDYVVNVIHEITPKGLSKEALFRLETFGCDLDEVEPERAGCTISVVDAPMQEYRDLRVRTRTSSRAKPKKVLFRFRDGRYVRDGAG